jgi:polysaccharide biosynthesis transport protein
LKKASSEVRDGLNIIDERELMRRMDLPGEEAEERLDLVRYWRAVNRNKWRILALVAAVALIAALKAQSLQPIYRASATILVEVGKSKITSIQDLYSWSNLSTYEYLQTQAGILQSHELARRLVRKLGLVAQPTVRPEALTAATEEPWYAKLLPAGFISRAAVMPPTAEERERSAAAAVQGGLTVKPVRNSQLIEISFESNNPKMAALIPNALADLYITADMEARAKAHEGAMAFLVERSKELRKKVIASEKALQDYRDREKILDVKGVSLSGASRQLEELTTSLVQARRQRADAEAALNQVAAAQNGGGSIESLPAVLRHPLIQKAKELEAEAERKVADASKRYGPEHRRMIAAQAELQSAKENLRRQLDIVVGSLGKEVEVARENEAAIARALQHAKADIQSFNRKEFELTSLEREVAANRQLYDLFIQRSKETRVSDVLQNPVARVIDPAMVPGAPSGPDKGRIVLVSVLAALMIAVALALLLERLDNRVKTSHEVEARLEVPSVGVVQKTKLGPSQAIERLFFEDPSTSFAESIRTIRSGVLLSGLDSPQKTVLVTSSIAAEGKTTVAANLAFALSHVKKTLLIDADMRRPQLGKVLGAPEGHFGLSSLVAGEVAPESSFFTVEGSELRVLPSGQVPANPLELLSSHRFADALERLKKLFEVIVIDSAPVQLVSDALVLATLSTGVLYVVKADDTPYPVARQGIKRLRRVDASILGAVLNQLDMAKADKYYGEYSGYGGRYYRKYGYVKR